MPTREQCRHALGEELGGFGVYETTGAGSTSTLVCTTAFKSTAKPADHLAHAWIYVPSATAPRQRQVPDDGLAPGTGTITVDDVYGSSIGSGVTFEACALMPLVDEGAKGLGISLTQCVNLGLRHIWVPDQIDLVSVANQTEYDLTPYRVWLDREERVLALRDPRRVGSQPYPISRMKRGQAWTLRFDGGVPTLTFLNKGYAESGHRFKLDVVRPAYTSVNGGESSVGLADDDDVTLAPLNDVVMAALVFAYKALATARSGGASTRYQTLYEEQLARARAHPRWDHEADNLVPRPERAPATEAA